MTELRAWLDAERATIQMIVKKVWAEESWPWFLNSHEFSRDDGRFFSIIQRQNLFINQPEVGILSFLLVRNSGAVFTLVQAKAEPGNVETTQIAPTIQATLSNYSRVHGGSETPYLSNLLSLIQENNRVVNDSLQSEHGERFYKKLNRNITAFIDDYLPAVEHYKWVPLTSVLETLMDDFAVNTDARSVLITSVWSELLDEGQEAFSLPDSEWTKRLKCSFAGESQITECLDLLNHFRWLHSLPKTKSEPLLTESNLGLTSSIVDKYDSDNRVEFFRITSNSREVPEWNQPLFVRDKPDRQVLLARPRGEGVEFLLSCRSEPGLANIAEFGASYASSDSFEGKSPLVTDVARSIRQIVDSTDPIVSVRQSDEGGRFLESICTYQIYFVSEIPSGFLAETLDSSGYIWVNLRTIQDLCLRGGTTTNELRSLVSLFLTWL